MDADDVCRPFETDTGNTAELDRIRAVESRALAEVAADFPLPHSAGTVLPWGALEAATRDFVVRWLYRFPASRQTENIARIRVPVGEYERLDGEDRMRYLLGIAPAVDDEIRRDLYELAAIRNAIVHRANLVDSRLLSLCPWLPYKDGDALDVSRDQFRRYSSAACLFAASTIEAAERSRPRD